MIAAARRIVVVGASLAGLRAAEELRHRGFDGTITVIGDEPHAPYGPGRSRWPAGSASPTTGW